MIVPYTIVLWCADTSHVVSFVATHLLRAGLDAANRGRIINLIPVAVGVAVPRRLPIISREVSARGLLRARRPRVSTKERFDYLLTFTSGDRVSVSNPLRNSLDATVIDARDLVAALESLIPAAMSKDEIVSLFNSTARIPRFEPGSGHGPHEIDRVAVTCQELVSQLSR